MSARSTTFAFAILLAAASGSARAEEAGPPPPPSPTTPQQIATPMPTAGVGYTEPPACSSRTDLLGISRVVEIDTTTGPHFGAQHKAQDFLADHEIVLTFDDGPMRRYTIPILDALDAQCTKATFFSVGRMAIADPATLKEVARRGHTVGIHTWSHKKLPTLNAQGMKYEVELGLSAVTKALGEPVTPFFRFPYLAENKSTLAYLESRGLGSFGIHVDSRDFRTRSPGTVLRNVLSQLDHTKKGIILFHDIQPSTAGALASLLGELKTRGYKVVHMVAKGPATTLPEYDAIAEKALKAKAVAAAANPLATRAATWPVEGAGATEPPAAKTEETLPWATTSNPAPAAASSATTPAPAKAPEHTTSQIDWTNPGSSWLFKPFGN